MDFGPRELRVGPAAKTVGVETEGRRRARCAFGGPSFNISSGVSRHAMSSASSTRSSNSSYAEIRQDDRNRLAITHHDLGFRECRFDSLAPAHSASRPPHLCRWIPIHSSKVVYQPQAGTSRTRPSFQMIIGKFCWRSWIRFFRVAVRCATDATRASGDISFSGIGLSPF